MDKDTLQQSSGQAQLYEAAYLISPAYSEEEARDFQQSLKNHVQNLGGLIDREGEMLKRRLFYPIKKMAEAYLVSFRFLLAPEKIIELRAQLNTKEILRFLLVQTKRQPIRTYRPRVASLPASPELQRGEPDLPGRQAGGPDKIAGFEKIITAPAERKIKPVKTAAPKIVEPAANIEEIDKKLEEILGK